MGKERARVETKGEVEDNGEQEYRVQKKIKEIVGTK
jgi:hypothetical protein